MPRKTIVIYEGDDFETLADLRAEVDRAERAASLASVPSRLGDADPDAVQAARDAFDAFVDVAASRAEAWELHSIGHEAWRKLLADHPVRMVDGDEDGKKVEHPDDAGWGVNTESFGKALLLFVDAEDPEHRTVAKLGDADPGTVLPKRLRRLSQGQFDTLWITAHALNTGGVSDPKLARFSTAPRSSES